MFCFNKVHNIYESLEPPLIHSTHWKVFFSGEICTTSVHLQHPTGNVRLLRCLSLSGRGVPLGCSDLKVKTGRPTVVSLDVSIWQ